MKTVLFAAVAGLAASAFAGPQLLDSSEYTITATPIDADFGGDKVLGTWYSQIPGPYAAAPAATGVRGVMDYQSTAPGDITLTSVRFVGGTANAGGIAFIDFFDTNSNFVDGFGFQLPQGGNFIWTITLNTPVIAPAAGFAQYTVDAASTGQWFLTTTAASVGNSLTAEATVGGAPAFYTLELNGDAVPTPASAAVLGFGGLLAARRRR